MRHRWLLQADIPHVLANEQTATDEPWVESDFREVLSSRSCIGMVVTPGEGPLRDVPVGHLLFDLRRHSLEVIRLLIHQEYRRQGYGRYLMRRIESRLSPDRRKKAIFGVRESDLGMQLFLRSCGWRASPQVLRRWFKDTGEDCYQFSLRVANPVMVEEVSGS